MRRVERVNRGCFVLLRKNSRFFTRDQFHSSYTGAIKITTADSVCHEISLTMLLEINKKAYRAFRFLAISNKNPLEIAWHRTNRIIFVNETRGTRDSCPSSLSLSLAQLIVSTTFLDKSKRPAGNRKSDDRLEIYDPFY